MTEVTNGQIDPAHYGPTGDIARHIASYCQGNARAHVYTAAFAALTTAQAEAEALRSLLAEIVPPKLIGESHDPYPEGKTTIIMDWDWLKRTRAALSKGPTQ